MVRKFIDAAKKSPEMWKLSVGVALIALAGVWAVYNVIVGTFHGSSGMDPNEIGDAIGGMTAPFVNLIAAILVYRSFRAQIKANEIIHKELDQNEVARAVDSIEKITDRIEGELSKFHYENQNAPRSIEKYWYGFERGVEFYLEQANKGIVTESVISIFDHPFTKLHNAYGWLAYADNRINQKNADGTNRIPNEDILYLKTRIMTIHNEYLLEGGEFIKKVSPRLEQLIIANRHLHNKFYGEFKDILSAQLQLEGIGREIAKLLMRG